MTNQSPTFPRVSAPRIDDSMLFMTAPPAFVSGSNVADSAVGHHQRPTPDRRAGGPAQRGPPARRTEVDPLSYTGAGDQVAPSGISAWTASCFGRTTVTGQAACSTQCRPTDPS